jgi:N-acetylmuramoyl-L-alanine amidase
VVGSNVARRSLALVALSVAACAPLPPAPAQAPLGVPVVSTPSPNFDERKPTFVVLHHTSDATAEQALRTLTNPERGVSSHYLIAREGRIHALVDEKARAWHAGESYWAGVADLNSVSIGIELDNTGSEPFADAQIEALLALLKSIKERYSIPAANFVGHGDIAPGRKVDPSAYFPWKRLAEQGFGIWCEPPYRAVPAGVDDALLLQTLGYNVWNFEAAVAAFKRRFSPEGPARGMTEKDRSLAYCLIMEKRSLAAQGQ